MTEEGTTQKVTFNIKQEPAWRRQLNIEVPIQQVVEAFEKTYREYRTKAKIPGFRPGKAPLNLVKQRYAEATKQEVLEGLLSNAYREAIKESQLLPISEPEIKDVEFGDGKPLKFTAEFDVRPEISLKEYTGFQLTRRTVRVRESDVQDFIDQLLKKKAILKPVERSATAADQVIVTIEKTSDRNNCVKPFRQENAAIDLDKAPSDAGDELQKKLVGMRIGEIRDIDVTYPENYRDPDYAGNRVRYRVILKEVKEKILPKFDDEFARQHGAPTAEEMRGAVRQTLEQQAARESQQRLRSEIIRLVVEKNRFPVPESLLQTYLNAVLEDFKKNYQKVDEQNVRQSYRRFGEELIQWELLQRKIAEKENLGVTKEDTDVWLKRFARAYNLDTEQASDYLAKSGKVKDVRDTILENKVFDFIVAHSQLTELTVEPEDQQKKGLLQ